jgi:hypothetical protein
VLQLLYEVRRLEEALGNMELELFEGGDLSTDGTQQAWRRPGDGVTLREVESARARLIRMRDELAVKQARRNRIEQEAPDDAAPLTPRSYRLHSAHHHVACSERRFAQWLTLQRTHPVWVTTKNGRRWWWYTDRFWWGDEGLRADHVKILVGELDIEGDHQRDLVDRVRADTFRRDP